MNTVILYFAISGIAIHTSNAHNELMVKDSKNVIKHIDVNSVSILCGLEQNHNVFDVCFLNLVDFSQRVGDFLVGANFHQARQEE